jgi:uncharacterized protein YndB with AHSA1/START domain
MSKSTFAYVTFIHATPERVWTALTTPDFMRQYWFDMHCESDWKKGSSWKLVFPDGRIADSGEIVESDPPRRLAIKWHNQWKPELKAEGHSLCTFTIEVVPDNAKPVVKLSIVHSMERDGSKLIEAVSGGWPRILSNLKSLLETGEIIMPAAGHN